MIDIKSIEELNNYLNRIDHVFLLDFYADWCHPCKQMLKILPSIEPKIEGIGTILKINTMFLSDIAEQYKVKSIPTFVFVQNGKEIDRIIGITSIHKITDKILESNKPIEV